MQGKSYPVCRLESVDPGIIPSPRGDPVATDPRALRVALDLVLQRHERRSYRVCAVRSFAGPNVHWAARAVLHRYSGAVIQPQANTAIVRATVGLAREFDIEIIAEGVETAARLEFLMRAGFSCAQGFYFSRPVPTAEDTQLLVWSRPQPSASWRGGRLLPNQRE
jgi:hypothetical protein